MLSQAAPAYTTAHNFNGSDKADESLHPGG